MPEVPTTDSAVTPPAVSNPASAAELDRIIFRRDLRAHLGVCGETMRLWLRDGKLPKPDINPTPRTTGWKLSTLRAAGFNL